MRRFLIVTLAIAGLFAYAAASAQAAANFKSSSFTVNNQGQLVCSGDVSGLGNVSSTPATCTADSQAVYQCINNGGKNPAAGNKTTTTGTVTDTEAVPVHNGRARPTITLSPTGPGSFSCPPGQSLYLVSACYTNIRFTVGGATMTEAGPVCNESPILVRQ
jgi:hypothetical protein